MKSTTSSSTTDGSTAARALMKSNSLANWSDARKQYPAALTISTMDEARKLELSKLDHFVSTEFAGPLTKEKLSKVVQWKLKKGTFRPGLLQKAESNTKEKLDTAWLDATVAIAKTLVEDVKGGGNNSTSIELDKAGVEGVKQLDKHLFGVGPATASAVVAAVLPECCAFMSDEALLGSGVFPESVGKNDLKYTLKIYAEFNKRCVEKAKELNFAATSTRTTGAANKDANLFIWTADSVQRALYAKFRCADHASAGGGTIGTTKSPDKKNSAARKPEDTELLEVLRHGKSDGLGGTDSDTVVKVIAKRMGVPESALLEKCGAGDEVGKAKRKNTDQSKAKSSKSSASPMKKKRKKGD
ncbi:unnamed protein product [Amoebophrya sp. A120]|nr:unnamed protein product [Amoebophrya sp. A120]|eukprot:GSA120T00011111001.1